MPDQRVAHAIRPVRNKHLDRLGEFGIGLRLVDRTVNDQRLIRLVGGDRPCQGMRAVEQRITDTVPNLVAPQTERAPEAVDIAGGVAVRRGRADGRAQTWQVVDGQQVLERRDVRGGGVGFR